MNRKILIIIFLSFFIISCKEDLYDYYKSSSETECIQNPWVPEILKEIKCKEICLYHNLDTNEIWGKFSIDEDISFELEDFNYNEKTYIRLKKIGLDLYKNSLVLKAEDQNFKINFFTDNPESKLLYFYGRLK